MEFINDKPTPPPPPPPPPDDHEGDLTVTKTVTGAGDPDREWHFRVELSDHTVNGWYGGMYFKDGVAEFTLRSGQSLTASGLPDGITYTVTEVEADQDGYTTQSSGASGTIPNGGTAHADFTNDKPEPGKGNLHVEKHVTGKGDKDKEFHFTVTFDPADALDAPGVSWSDGVTRSGGTLSFTLKDGQSVDVNGLPAGTRYTVTETEYGADGYTTTVTGSGTVGADGAISGEIPDGGTASARFVNDIPDNPPPPPPDDKDETPETSDPRHMRLWQVTMGLSLLGMVLALCPWRRKRGRRERR